MSMRTATAAALAFGTAVAACAPPASAGYRAWGAEWVDDRPYYANQPAFFYVVPPPRLYIFGPQPVVTYPGPTFVAPPVGYGGGRCGWLYRTAQETGSGEWWRQYQREC